MRRKNETPFLFGAFASSRSPPRPSVTLVVKGTFRLRPGEPVSVLEGEQGSLSGDVFAPDDDERTGALLAASDLVDHKPTADVLVRASCHTPGGKPATMCPVRVTLGAWTKTLRVVGQRVFKEGLLGAAPSDPAPFTEVPLDFAHAFGGPEFPENPAGKGAGTPDLHHIESPSDVFTSRGDRVAPACFAPISPFWPQRRVLAGEAYGKGYQEKRAPYVAEDFDFAYHNAAPPDQQIPYPRGDEEMSFLNLHPAAASFSVRLPGLRIRGFVNDDRGSFREVPMVLDTVLADLAREVLVLTWRGVSDVREDDLADVVSALAISEPLSAEPRSAADVRDSLRRFEEDPTGFERRREELFGPAEPAAEPASNVRVYPVRESLSGRLRDLPADAKNRLRLALDRADAVPVENGPLGVRLDYAMQHPPEAGTVPIAFPRKPGSLPYVPLGHRLRSIREAASRARAQLARSEVAPHVKDAKAHEQALAELSALEKDPFVRQLDPYGTRPEGPGKGEPGPGADLSGRDLSGQDLSGKDLSGANLEGALLMRANLEKANLRGARMKHAILHEADLSEADLTEADLTQANLGSAKAEKAIFRGANVDQTTFEKARLAGADLSNAAGEYALLTKADLSDSVFRGAKLHKAFLDGADLTRADLSASTLTSCRFTEAKAETANFANAVLDRSSFERTALKEAIFVEARGERTLFRHAVLTGADLRYTVFKDAFFDEARADGAKLAAASLRGARLYRVSLVRADARQADLLGADLRKADLTGATFAGASLFQAKLRLARRDGCDFEGANLTRVVQDGRQPPEK